MNQKEHKEWQKQHPETVGLTPVEIPASDVADKFMNQRRYEQYEPDSSEYQSLQSPALVYVTPFYHTYKCMNFMGIQSIKLGKRADNFSKSVFPYPDLAMVSGAKDREWKSAVLMSEVRRRNNL